MINKIIEGDCLKSLREMPDKSVNCCITSPPYYGLRDYGNEGQIGLEETPEQFVEQLVQVFREVKRILKDDGTLWLNLGDSYNGSGKGGNPEGSEWTGFVGNKKREASAKQKKTEIKNLKPKDLIGIPWMVAFALRADGWWLRQDIIWSKKNPMPESVTDRCTKAHEYIFLLSKSKQYYYDADAIKEKSITFENRPNGVERNRIYNYDSKENNNPIAYRKNIKGNKNNDGVTRTTAGLNLKTQQEKTQENRNKRSVWTVNTKPYSGAHFATFPEELITDCIKAGCPENGIVLDPFGGAGTTAVVARKLNRNYLLCELNPDYIKIAENRLIQELGLFI